jgi:hypothetical protein
MAHHTDITPLEGRMKVLLIFLTMPTLDALCNDVGATPPQATQGFEDIWTGLMKT